MIDKILKILDIEPKDGIKIISNEDSHVDILNIDINSNMIILGIKNNISKLKENLTKIYGKNYYIKLINVLDEKILDISLDNFDNSLIKANNVVFIPKVDKKTLRVYDFSDIMGIMKILRGDEGCPWDKKQDHKSLRQSLIEEAYEVVEAIDNKDMDSIKEELGDLLLQVVFHSQLASENGDFYPLDVTTSLANKLIYRHPHIFSQKSVENTDRVVYNWNKLKYEDRQITTLSEKLKDITRLPALMYSYKAQEKAAEVGFDWDSIDGAVDKVYEELSEVMEVIHTDKERTEEELGDLLFAIVNVARFLGINPEVSLNMTINKFINRLEKVESKAMDLNKSLEAMSLEEIDVLWEEVKSQE